MKNARYHLGLGKEGKREVFRSVNTPTQESHGHLYFATVGPFRSKRGAYFMRDHGKNNPHCQHVRDAERLAKIHFKHLAYFSLEVCFHTRTIKVDKYLASVRDAEKWMDNCLTMAGKDENGNKFIWAMLRGERNQALKLVQSE